MYRYKKYSYFLCFSGLPRLVHAVCLGSTIATGLVLKEKAASAIALMFTVLLWAAVAARPADVRSAPSHTFAAWAGGLVVTHLGRDAHAF